MHSYHFKHHVFFLWDANMYQHSKNIYLVSMHIVDPNRSTSRWMMAVTLCLINAVVGSSSEGPIAALDTLLLIDCEVLTRLEEGWSASRSSIAGIGSPKVTPRRAPIRGRYLYGKGRPSGINWSKPVIHIGITTGGSLASIKIRPLYV